MDYCQFFLKTNTPEAWPNSLSLKEALELFRPDFISQSQGRVRMMEQKKRRGKGRTSAGLIRDEDVRRRRCTTCAGPVRDGDVRRRRCTTPDPLSDNLFKPRKRSISVKEMQQRSRRLYNKLPEVEKKKQEEEKRTVFQANRLRVNLFKKKLLDHILQR
nr:(E2-independent) E3 ubiquitin-conjugating enzyme FATS-like [Syngnathus scovelli]